MSANSRIREIRTKLCNDSTKELASLLNVSSQAVSNYIREGYSVGEGVLYKLLAAFPQLNANWLLTGEGSMFKHQEAKPVENPIFEQIPLIPISARAGYLTDFGDEEYIKDLPTVPVIVDKHYKGKYRVFEVEGDSMYDGSFISISDKDKILCREVQKSLWQYKLHINDWFFVIVHRTEGIIVKQIIEHDVENSLITCHSLNPIFEDFTINLNDVLELYNVIKIVDRTTRI